MRGALTSLPNTPSWCGAQLKETRATLPLEEGYHFADLKQIRFSHESYMSLKKNVSMTFTE